MSEVMLAGRIPVDAPLPRAPLHGLLGSPAAATPAQDRDHWQSGATVYPYPNAMPDSIDPCSDGTFRQKLEAEGVELPDPFDAFTAYLGEVCLSPGIGAWDSWRARADAAMTARTSWALERQLAWGFYLPGNPFLADADMELPASITAVPAAVAIAYLDGFLARFGQQGVIHVTPEVASYLGDPYLIADARDLRTRAGTPVIVGTGYSFVEDAPAPSPDVSPAVEAADAGQSWIFASSPITYRTGGILSLPETLSEALDRETNDVVYRAERDLWVAFDGGPHAGVLADWST